MDSEAIRKMAEAHWEYTEKIMHLVAVEKFVHGFKHGAEHEREIQATEPPYVRKTTIERVDA